MITIGMNYEVIEGKEDLFKSKFKEILTLLDHMTAHQESNLFANVFSEKPTYLVVSRWETMDAFHDFINSEAFEQTKTWGREGILAARPTHHVYQTVRNSPQS